MKKQLKLASQRVLISLGLGLALTLALLWIMSSRLTPIVHAAGFTVTKTTDTFDGVCNVDCSLRDALFEANNNAVDDTITLLAGTYVLTIPGTGEDVAVNGDLDINDGTGNLTLIGNGAIIDGGSIIDESIFHIRAGNVEISNLTVQNGRGLNGGGIQNLTVLTLTNVNVLSNTAPQGGGIYSGITADTRLTLINTLVASNTAGDIFGWGGGILNINDASLTLISSTVRNNRANFGGNPFVGGGGLANAGTATLINSLISQNVISTTSTQPGGGGIDNHGVLTLTNTTVQDNVSNQDGGGIWNLGSLTVVNSTLSGNRTATHGGGIFLINADTFLNNVTIANNTAALDGGGLVRGSVVGTYTLANTIIAGNVATRGPDISGTVVSAGYNLIQNPTGAIINGVTTGNITGTNPALGPLVGAIPYHPLLANSPAIDAGNNVNPVGGAFPACAAIDQRGQTRPVDGDEDGTARCDIGAYEFTTAASSLYLPIVLKNS